MRIGLMLVLLGAAGCSVGDAVADLLEAEREVPLEQGSKSRRGAPEVAPPPPVPPRDLDPCGHGKVLECKLALLEIEKAADDEKRRVYAAARELCMNPTQDARAAWKGREPFDEELSGLCGSLSRSKHWSGAEAKTLLARACELTTEGEHCFSLSMSLFIRNDPLYDLPAALPLLERGCSLGHGVSCNQLKTVEDAIRRDG